MSNALTAANAYMNQLKIMQGATNSGSSEETPGNSFADMVKGAAEGTADALRKSEELQMNALTGTKVDLADLVTAVSNAELTLNTVVAVRDRVINAYQDIIKMPI